MRLLEILKSPTAKNGAVFTFFSFCNKGVGFVLLLILAHYIDPGEYGTLNLFNTFIQLFSIIICLGSSGYMSVSFFKKDKTGLCRIINSIFIIAGGVLLVILLLLSIFSGALENIFGLPVKYQFVAIFVCFFQIFNSINLDIWRLEEKPFSYGLYSLSSVVLNFIITLYLVIGLKYGWLGRLYAEILIAIIYFCISIFFLIKRGYIVFEWPHRSDFKESINFGIPLIPHQASGWLKQGADRVIINNFLSVTAVGLYSFAMNFANIIYIFNTAFNSTNSVYIYKNLANGYSTNKARLIKQERVMMCFFAAISIAISIVCYIAIPFLAPKYTDSRVLLFPLCLAAMFGCFYTLFVNYLFYYEKTKQLMIITLSASVIQVLLSIFITRYGVIYTAYFYAIAQFLTFIAVFIYSKKVLSKVELNEKTL